MTRTTATSWRVGRACSSRRPIAATIVTSASAAITILAVIWSAARYAAARRSPVTTNTTSTADRCDTHTAKGNAMPEKKKTVTITLDDRDAIVRLLTELRSQMQSIVTSNTLNRVDLILVKRRQVVRRGPIVRVYRLSLRKQLRMELVDRTTKRSGPELQQQTTRRIPILLYRVVHAPDSTLASTGHRPQQQQQRQAAAR